MAFGIKRVDVVAWKQEIDQGQIAFLTHYWLDDRFPGCKTVTKVGCNDLERLAEWGKKYGLKKNGFITGRMAILILIYWGLGKRKFLKPRILMKGWSIE